MLEELELKRREVFKKVEEACDAMTALKEGILEYERILYNGLTLAEKLQEKREGSYQKDGVFVACQNKAGFLYGTKEYQGFKVTVKCAHLVGEASVFNAEIETAEHKRCYEEYSIPSKYKNCVEEIRTVMNEYMIKYDGPLMLGTQLVNAR